MANEMPQSSYDPPESDSERFSQVAPRRDSVVDSAKEVDDAKIPKALKKERLNSMLGYDPSTSSDISSSDSEEPPVATQARTTQSILSTTEAYAPSQIQSKKRDSKTESDLPVPQRTRRKHGEKRPSPPLSAQTQPTSESKQGDVLPDDEAIPDVSMKDASATPSDHIGQPSSSSQMKLTGAPDAAPDGSAEMPPPAAPASMLWNIKRSDTAKGPEETIQDLFICGRLGTTVVTLFRMGKAKEAKALAQYTIDLVGEESWQDMLNEYMSVDSEPNAEEWVTPLLQDVIVVLKEYDPASSGFLNILLPFLVER